MTLDEFWEHIRTTKRKDPDAHAERLTRRLAKLSAEDVVDFQYWWDRMMTEARKDKSGFGALGMAFGSALMGPMVDSLVSPAGMRAALLANREEKTAAAAPAASALHLPREPVIVRRNFSEFLVTAKDQPNSGLLFKRHGLSWKLSGVELPPDAST